MLKSKNTKIKELQEENGRLKEEIGALRLQLCKCKPIEGAPKGKHCEVTIVDDIISPAKIEGNKQQQRHRNYETAKKTEKRGSVMNKNDFANL